MAFEDARGELRGKYAEDELVEDLLSQGEEFNYLKFQAAQDAADLRLQMKQNAITDQRLWANAAGMWVNAMLGKAAEAFPKSVVEDVVSETISRNTANQEDTSKDTLDNMVSRVSQVEDLVTKAVNDLQTQMTSVVSTLARIEAEGE